MTVIEVKSRSGFTAALTKTASGPWRALFLRRRREVAAEARHSPPPVISHTLLRLFQAHNARKRQFVAERPHDQLPSNCRSFPLSPRACSSFKISAKRSSLISARACGVSSVSGAARDEAAFWPRWIEAMTPVAVGAPLLPELHHLAVFQALQPAEQPAFLLALRPAADSGGRTDRS